jgi:hypothetical protein
MQVAWPFFARVRDPLIILLLVVCFYWKLSLSRQFTVWHGGDNGGQVLPWFAFEARQIRQGDLPLWDPHSWGGQSLIGQAQPGLCFPLNWLLFVTGFGGRPARVIHFANIYFVAIHFIAALGLYALARELQRSRFASILAALTFTASAYMGSVHWPQKLNGAMWVPLVFLFFIRVWKGRDLIWNAAASGACLGAAFLSGHPEAPLFTGLAIGASWLWILWESRAAPRFWPLLLALGVSSLFAALIAAVQMLPALEYGHLAWRWVGAKNPVDWTQPVPYSVHGTYSLGLRSLIGIVVPWFSEINPPFLGWMVLTLATTGLITAWKIREVRFFFSVALGGLLFSIGKNNPLHGVLYSLVPMVEKARSPGFAMLLFGFGASVLFAYGIDGLPSFHRLHRLWARRILTLLTGAGLALTSLTILAVTFSSKTGDPNMLMLSGFAALASAVLLYTSWHEVISRRTAHLLIAMLVVLELGNVATADYPNIEQGWPIVDDLSKYADIAAFMKNQPGAPRIEADSASIHFNFGDWYGVDTFGAYLASVTKNVFWVYSQNPYWCRMLFATQYYAGKKPQSPNQTLVFTSQDGIPVYRSPDALPRVWITHHLIAVPEVEGSRRLQTGDKLRAEAFTFGKVPALESCSSPDGAHLLSAEADSQVISTEATCRGLLIDADAYYPGWRATVDDHEVEILQVYGALRAVSIPAGRHTVKFQYRPMSVIAGFILTLAGCAGLILLRLRRPTDAPLSTQ